MEEGSNGVEKTNKIEALSVETDGVKIQAHEHVVNSAHTIDHDSWEQVGLMLVTGFNCGYILSFSNLMLVPLGWSWGIVCLVFVGAFTWYANWLLAGFHIIDGRRFIRYRDLMGFVFGRKMYYLTWVLQFFTLLLGNMGFILLGGRALKVCMLDTTYVYGGSFGCSCTPHVYRGSFGCSVSCTIIQCGDLLLK